MSKKPTTGPNISDNEPLDVAISRDYYVVQHNDLIQKSSFNLEHRGASLTLSEWKMLLYIISRIKPDAAELEPQIFDIASFCKVCGITATEGAYYKQLKAAITQLASRVMWLTTDTTETTVRWIDRAVMKKGSGKVQIKLDDMLRPYLLNLCNNFTQFPLHNIIRMKSKYGLMLYQLLRSYAYKSPVLRFNIEDLKEHLDCTSYKNFANFRTKVINPALEDINTYSELAVTVQYEKTGRFYTDAIFTLKDLDKGNTLEEREEAQSRYYNTELELDQMTMF